MEASVGRVARASHERFSMHRRRPRQAKALAGLGLVGALSWYAARNFFGSPLMLTSAAFLASIAVVELVRRKAGIAWWASHAALLPFGIVVLIPWVYFINRGYWYVGLNAIDTGLNETWKVNLLALAGLSSGTTLALLTSGRRPVIVAREVHWKRIGLVVAGSLFVYFLSFAIAGRPLSAIWRLSGDIRYFDNPEIRTPLQVLDYFPAAGAFALLAATAVRRKRTTAPGRTELICLALLSLVSLGTGARSRIYVLVLGWVALQFGPLLSRSQGVRKSSKRGVTRAVAFVGVVAAIAGAVYGAQVISQLRSRGLGAPSGSLGDRTMRDLDVVGPGELLVERGAALGSLRGRSYTELPLFVVPRRLAGGEKPTALAADALVRQLIDSHAGYAAPLWLEPALNFGPIGSLCFMALYGFGVVRVLGMSPKRGSGPAAAVRLLGPVLVLVSYFILSRLTTYQMLLSIGTVAAGCLAASRCIEFGPEKTAGENGLVMAVERLPAIRP